MKDQITQTCAEIQSMLLEKNKAYGDSASDPIRIFSKTETLEQINVRIDDKLSRIARGSEFDGDDTELDLIGYLILKRAIKAKRAKILKTPVMDSLREPIKVEPMRIIQPQDHGDIDQYCGEGRR